MKAWIVIINICSFSQMASGNTDTMRKLFPTGYYKLQASNPWNKNCPASSQFVWHKQNHGAWALRISPRLSVYVPKDAFRGKTPQPDRYNSPKSPCQGYKFFRFKDLDKKIVVSHTYRCSEKRLERAFQTVIERRDNKIIIFQDQVKGLELVGKKRERLFGCSYLLQI